MIQTLQLTPGVLLRHYPDHRFKKSAMSIQLMRPMTAEESALNALLPAVLLRGCKGSPDIRAITDRLDNLYGASVGTLVRRIGDVQSVGLYFSFMEDRFALEGDRILEPMMELLQELLLQPVMEGEVLSPDFVESEKRNLISTIDSELNDKRSYAAGQMLRRMCKGDSFAVPRLGSREAVEAITPERLTHHYHHILRTSPVEIFYVGSAEISRVAQLLMPLARALAEAPVEPPSQSGFTPHTQPGEYSEEMDLSQSKLSMGFTCGITAGQDDFAPAQVFNSIYGAGMTSKLFVHVREELSLCYYANSAYYGSKGILTVSCGIELEDAEQAKTEILRQLELCRQGQITPEELDRAKSAIISSLSATPDSPGALEGYYATAMRSNLRWDLEEYMARIRAVEIEDVVRVARQIQLHTVFLLKGVAQ